MTATLVYLGIFITADSKASLMKVKRHLQSPRFYQYAKFLGKDLQQNYKSISTKMIREYGNP